MDKEYYRKEVRPTKAWFRRQKAELPTPVIEPVKKAPPKKTLTLKEKLARRASTRATRRRRDRERSENS